MKIAMVMGDNREAFRDYQNPVPWFGTAPEALLQGFANLPGTEVHVVTCAQRRMTSPEKLAGNIFFHSLHVPKIGWMRTGYQGCIRATRRKLQEIKPDIVHGQGTERDCALSAVFSGYPNVLTLHGNIRLVAQFMRARPFSFYWLAAKLEAFAIPRADGIVCISSYTRQAVQSLARQTWLLHNAVEKSFFEIENKPASPPQVLCVGTVEKRKNQNALIRALDRIPEKNFKVIFLGLASPGKPYSREFLKLVAERPWCHYRGFADREYLKDFLATTAGLILPSLEDNCPMVILEAMAAGVPVAAAQVGGVPDLIRHRETGLLFNPLDDSALVSATLGLMDNSARERAIGAREDACARFYPETVASRHVEIYREVLAARG